uniref:Reverse transcriptase/retrotransposon-derived protein RNase H-like domain-containing protein n=1 Tax=Romanomermis culicivorax TaxID=13658 RepID=A0A915IZY7_ROMCU
MVTNVPLLGHLTSSTHMKPDPKSLAAIRKVPILQSITNVRSFLGFISYCREFWPPFANHAEWLGHLTHMLEQTNFEWSNEFMMAFNKLNSLLMNDLQLTIFNPDPPAILATDASNIDLDACQSQIAGGRCLPTRKEFTLPTNAKL